MKNQKMKDPGRVSRNGSLQPSILVIRIAGALTLIAMLALGATGALAALVTAAVVALVGFAVSGPAVKRFHREGESPLDPDFQGVTGQHP